MSNRSSADLAGRHHEIDWKDVRSFSAASGGSQATADRMNSVAIYATYTYSCYSPNVFNVDLSRLLKASVSCAEDSHRFLASSAITQVYLMKLW